jgi:hypothetical protein
VSNGTVDNRTFWSGLFNSAEKDGEVLRVGEYRSAPINDFWAVLKDNAEYPSATGILESQQEALDWMVETVRERQREQARRDRS